MTARIVAAALCCLLLAGCQSATDRQYSDMQLILERTQ